MGVALHPKVHPKVNTFANFVDWLTSNTANGYSLLLLSKQPMDQSQVLEGRLSINCGTSSQLVRCDTNYKYAVHPRPSRLRFGCEVKWSCTNWKASGSIPIHCSQLVDISLGKKHFREFKTEVSVNQLSTASISCHLWEDISLWNASSPAAKAPPFFSLLSSSVLLLTPEWRQLPELREGLWKKKKWKWQTSTNSCRSFSV